MAWNFLSAEFFKLYHCILQSCMSTDENSLCCLSRATSGISWIKNSLTLLSLCSSRIHIASSRCYSSRDGTQQREKFFFPSEIFHIFSFFLLSFLLVILISYMPCLEDTSFIYNFQCKEWQKCCEQREMGKLLQFVEIRESSAWLEVGCEKFCFE